MVNYQGVRRMKNFLKRVYGVAPKDFGAYERYSGYERLGFRANGLGNVLVIYAFANKVRFFVEQYDDEGLRHSSHVEDISIEEFRGELPDNTEADVIDSNELVLGKDKSLREKLPAPCNSCGFGHPDPKHLLSSSGMNCSYGENPCDFLINEGRLPCQGKWVI